MINWKTELQQLEIELSNFLGQYYRVRLYPSLDFCGYEVIVERYHRAFDDMELLKQQQFHRLPFDITIIDKVELVKKVMRTKWNTER